MSVFTFEDMAVLYGKRAKRVEDLRSIDRQAGDHELTAEQEQRADKLGAEIDGLDGQIQRGIKERGFAQTARAIDDLLHIGPGSSPVKREQLARGLADMLGVGTKGQTRSIEMTETGIEEQRDLLTSTSGASVVTEFATGLEAIKTQGSPIWSAARRVTTTHTRDIKYPALSAHGAAVFLAEGGALTENDPTLATFTLEAWKCGQLLQISFEAEHEVAAWLDVIAKDMTTNIATAVDTQLVLGDGTTEPQGLTVGFTSTSVSSGVIAPTSDNLVNTVYDIASPYRNSGRMFWAFNDAVWNSIRLLKDGQGNYLWQPTMAAGEPDMLLGFPVISDSNFANPGADALIGCFFDADKFLVRDTPLRLERSADYAFANDVATYRAIQHVDSQVLDVAAGTTVENEAS